MPLLNLHAIGEHQKTLFWIPALLTLVVFAYGDLQTLYLIIFLCGWLCSFNLVIRTVKNIIFLEGVVLGAWHVPLNLLLSIITVLPSSYPSCSVQVSFCEINAFNGCNYLG